MLSFLGRYASLTKYLAVAVACLAAFIWYRHQVNTAYEDGIEEGGVRERAQWLARESSELAQKNAKLQFLEESYRALERKSAEDVAAAAAKAKKEMDHAKRQEAAALADRDRFRLRWSTQCAPAGEGGDRSATTAPGAAAAGAQGTAACELPGAVRDDLIRLAVEANAVVVERNELSEIAQKDREVCR